MVDPPAIRVPRCPLRLPFAHPKGVDSGIGRE